MDSILQSPPERKTMCHHCGDNCLSESIAVEGKYFCCNGCKTVFEILSANALCDYYELEKR
ncbi:MAG TPA: heavy metal translocating P-type ATPase metal-binding domain-containing protein, partial [Vampirovibrionales bacterium]